MSLRLLTLTILLSVSLATADQISIPHPPESNTKAKAAEVKANFDTLVTESNAQDLRLNQIELTQPSLYVNGERVGAVLNHFDRFNWWIITDKGYAFKVNGTVDSPLNISYASKKQAFLTDDCTGDVYELAGLNYNTIYPVPPVVGLLATINGDGQPFYFTYTDSVTGVAGYTHSLKRRHTAHARHLPANRR